MPKQKPEKTHIYFMPGMAASPSIFEGIRLDPLLFELHFLEWFVPNPKASLESYAKDMAQKVKHNLPILLGVSFGGLLVQEMAKHMEVSLVIAISCVKTRAELPWRMHFARRTKIHRLLPTALVSRIDFLVKYAFGDRVTKRLKLYEQYLSVRDKNYLSWAIDAIVNWKQEQLPEKLIHIHGDKDAVFPIKNIRDCIVVKNGTHTMILHRARWFNEHLPELLLNPNYALGEHNAD
ncbi:MAG: alpha/beta hydrolase [Bacteroidota bacterium]